jgi:uncharacterized membrane protein
LTKGEESADGGEDRAIEAALAPYVQPGKQQQAVRAVTTVISKVHQGPLPAPEDMAHYEHVLPGAAERIFQLTEREQRHRHGTERTMVLGEYATRLLGQLGALLIVALLVALAAFCAYIGQPLAAALVVAIGGAAAAYLKHSAQSQQEKKPPPSAPSKKRRPR